MKDPAKHWMGVAIDLYENLQTTFAEDVSTDISRIKTDKEFNAWREKEDIVLNRPLVMGLADRVVLMGDLGKSVKTRALFGGRRGFQPGERFALNETMVMYNCVAPVVLDSIGRTDGTFFGVKMGDMVMAMYGIVNKDLVSIRDRALSSADEIQVRMISEASNMYKAYVAAREIDLQLKSGNLPSLEALSFDAYHAMSLGIEKELGVASETGRNSHLQMSLGIGVGPMQVTLIPTTNTFRNHPWRQDNLDGEGPAIVKAARAENAAHNGSTIYAPEDPSLELSLDDHLTDPMDAIPTKDGHIMGQEFRGFRVFNHATFRSRIPMESYLANSTLFEESKLYVRKVSEDLDRLDAEYHEKRIAVPSLERDDVYHGFGLMTASLLHVLTRTMKHVYLSQQKRGSVDTRIQQAYSALDLLPEKESTILALQRNLGRYYTGHVVEDTGFVHIDQDRRKEQEAKETQAKLEEMTFFYGSRIPELAYLSRLSYDDVASRSSKRTADYLDALNLCERWFELVSPTSDTPKETFEAAQAVINQEFRDSVFLEPVSALVLSQYSSAFNPETLPK